MSDATTQNQPLAAARRSWFRGWGWFVLMAIVLIGAYGLSRPLPFYVFSPGSATQVGPLVDVPAEQDYPHRGQVLLTTVSVRRALPLDLVWAKFHSDWEVIGSDQYSGGVPDKEILETGFFPLDALPDGTTRATSARLLELQGLQPLSPYW